MIFVLPLRMMSRILSFFWDFPCGTFWRPELKRLDSDFYIDILDCLELDLSFVHFVSDFYVFVTFVMHFFTWKWYPVEDLSRVWQCGDWRYCPWLWVSCFELKLTHKPLQCLFGWFIFFQIHYSSPLC